MSTVTIYHNPRCSKSRNTLSLLQEHGVEPDIVLYLETAPAAQEIQSLLDKLGMSARDIVRSSEDDYKSCGLDKDSDEAQIISAMIDCPKLIERPIVVKGERAVIGRPPENVLELIR